MHFCESDLIGAIPDPIAGFLDNFDFYWITMDAIVVTDDFFFSRPQDRFRSPIRNEEIIVFGGMTHYQELLEIIYRFGFYF